ncbi:hypothetical protein EVJ58_g5052 [Rhodofomes roseus]|uniref:RNA helicase n=1 Tax=Rhodofomes roseus TaxID=34475 RepID=A0A4Y9YDH5_9APHY|nr:hypothetical protein EVJ58_g5052 [Rhodofomes roseus]
MSSSAAEPSSSKKAKKSKKSRREGDQDNTESHISDGAGAEDEKAERKKRKKEKKLKAAASVGEEDHTMAVDDPNSASAQPEKKKKRKRDEDDARSDPSTSKKDKKKRRKEGDLAEATQSPESGGGADDHQTGPSSSKKDKKRKRKHDADGAEQPEADADQGTSKEDKKKRHKDTALDASESKTSPKVTKISGNAPSSADIEAFLSKHAVTIHVPEGSDPVTPVLSFDQFDIPSDLQSAFTGFKEPTPIQACSWPPALQGKDVWKNSRLWPSRPRPPNIFPDTLIQERQRHDSVRPRHGADARTRHPDTRHLAELGESFGIASVAVFGGVDKGPQIKALKNANKDGKTTRIIVGTPGRILDLVNDGICDLSRVSYLVLDEADRMLDKGFENDIRSIIGHAKQGAERQTLMFSATWPDAVRRLASTFQRDPVRVTVGSDDLTANSRVEQVVEVFDDSRSKDQRLLNQLRSASHKKSGSPEDARILVFALYKKGGHARRGHAPEQWLLRHWPARRYVAGGTHGSPPELQEWPDGPARRDGRRARGLDIPNVGVVINYTFPLTIEDYIHRIGRTGRGGKSGKSITFFTGDNHERALAGELARVLRESGFECEGLRKFPMTIKKKTHSVYGAFFKDDIPVPTGPTKITFD